MCQQDGWFLKLSRTLHTVRFWKRLTFRLAVFDLASWVLNWGVRQDLHQENGWFFWLVVGIVKLLN